MEKELRGWASPPDGRGLKSLGKGDEWTNWVVPERYVYPKRQPIAKLPRIGLRYRGWHHRSRGGIRRNFWGKIIRVTAPSTVCGAIELIRQADQDRLIRDRLLQCFTAADCRFPSRSFLLSPDFTRLDVPQIWPAGFKDKWRTSGYRGLFAARRNGPPRSAFICGGGEYGRGCELAHLYDRPTLRQSSLGEGLHFTQSANLICMPPYLHEGSERDEHLLWIFRGLSFLSLRYDPLGVFSGAKPNLYGFVEGRTPEVFWP